MAWPPGASPLLLDGAMGTALRARGLAPDQLVERWVLDRPEEVARVHAEHVAAGAQVVLTATFLTHPCNLVEARLVGFTGEIRRCAVALARQSGAHCVAGVVGPLPPSMPPGEVERVAEAAAADLARLGADLLVLETITHLQEGEARVKGCAAVGLPVVASVVPGLGAAQDVMTTVRLLKKAGASILGVNCAAPLACSEVLQKMADAGAGALWAKPSAGSEEPSEWARATAALQAHGVAYLGGCCGSGAAHLEALRRELLGTAR